MNDHHYHWAFLAYNDADMNGDRISHMVKISVIGYLCEDDARAAARDAVTRDQFHLCDVYECSTCGFQRAYAKSMKDWAYAKSMKDWAYAKSMKDWADAAAR